VAASLDQLPKIRTYKNKAEIKMFDAGSVEYHKIKHFSAFCQHFVLFSNN